MHDYLVPAGTGHLRCFSYAYDGDEAAWYAIAAAHVCWAANGVEDDEATLDGYMSLAVNDHPDLIELIANNWDDVPEEVREHLASDLADFVTEHFDYLVAPDELATMVSSYLKAGLWAGTTVELADESEVQSIPLDDLYDIDQCVNRWDAEADCKSFIVQAWPLLTWWRTAGDFGSWEQIGHDFLLTRDHHGTGFWDRGNVTDYYVQSTGRKLSDIAHTFGDSGFEVEDESWFRVAEA